MTAPEPSRESSASLDELIALNDEIAALARAGVPLPSGLRLAGRDLGGRTGRLAANLAARLQEGESLSDALAASPQAFPPVYRAVVDAGIASGRLPAALEGLAATLRRMAEVRRLTGVALVYPLLVVLLVYVLFLFSLRTLQPAVRDAYESFRVPESSLNAALTAIGEMLGAWVWWAPVVVAVAVAVAAALGWYVTGRGDRVGRPRLSRLLGGHWPATRVRTYVQLSTFADILALLIEQGVPLDRGLPMAGLASGSRELETASARMSDELSSGQSHAVVPEFPPMIAWLLAGGGNPKALVMSLRRTSEAYRRRAERWDDWLRIYLPILLSVVIGGTAAVLYALSVFVPWYGLLTESAAPIY